MPIYTKSGDAGETGLFGGGRVPKDDPRVEAYGEVDELNASLGFCRSLCLLPELDEWVETLQAQLFTLGAVLATPSDAKAAQHIPHVEPGWAQAMERAIDRFDAELPAMRSFILPGGTQASSALHLSRTVCRRAERKLAGLCRSGQVGWDALVFLNRLSDLLFTLARYENHRAGVTDVPWKPPKH